MRQYDRPDEQPRRTPLTRLWCGAAVLGIGASFWAFWLTYDDARDRAASERKIAAACGGLVSGEDVMDLRGGMVRAETADREVDPRYPPGVCRIYRVPESGNSDGLLTLALRTSSDATPVHFVGDDIGSEPFDYFGHEEKGEDEGDVTRRADRTEGQPLGDGPLGVYGWLSARPRLSLARHRRRGAGFWSGCRRVPRSQATVRTGWDWMQSLASWAGVSQRRTARWAWHG